jgi:hypothetical protein
MPIIDHGVLCRHSEHRREVCRHQNYLAECHRKVLFFILSLKGLHLFSLLWGLKILDADIEFGGFGDEKYLEELIQALLLSLQVYHFA